MALTHTLGYPRIGQQRELKKATEKYWSSGITQHELHDAAAAIRRNNWQDQQQAGIDLIPSNDFSLYDHVLDTSALVGTVPTRFEHTPGSVDTDTYFALARGVRDSVHTTVALGLRKWFDTNYHYLVPEFRPGQEFALSTSKPFDEYREAREQALQTKPVLLGPISYLTLGKSEGDAFDQLTLLENLLPVYEQILQQLNQLGADWIQLDEPALVLDLSEQQQRAFQVAYDRLRSAAGSSKLLLGTYFGDLRENLDTAIALPVDAIHLDGTVQDGKELLIASEKLRDEQSLSAGVVDGRNVWANDLSTSLELLQRLEGNIGSDRLLIAPSSSLQFVPLDASRETTIDSEVQTWLSFARQKLAELVTLRDALAGNDAALRHVDENRQLFERIARSTKRTNSLVQQRMSSDLDDEQRRSPSQERSRVQADSLQLPPLPTTTIGSFPQTLNIRKLRSQHRRGELDDERYRSLMSVEIAGTIHEQEEADVDVLVHGEPERNDMVQYFAEELDGFDSTEHGWVQSYGSRYVRPPIIYGDVSRPHPITTDWTAYAQSLTEKPVKGMLTGPVTIRHWSFVRDDIPESETCRQIALAIRDEVQDLEAQGTRIIQVDEPAIREGLPLRTADQAAYLQWATTAFRQSIVNAAAGTQIHTHMCYADFSDILAVLQDLDIDVISLEAARSRLQLVQDLQADQQPFAIGPGVWDVHSPLVPSQQEIEDLLRFALQHIPAEQLWVNPDCGLKTRAWKEVTPAMKNMVAAAKTIRDELRQPVSP